MGMKQKKYFLFEKNKKSKWPTQKNLVFQTCQFSIFFCKKKYELVIGSLG
jgi:hypothetical protein